MAEKLMKLPIDELQEIFEENLREAEENIVFPDINNITEKKHS
ncbi:hypothetical protein ACQKFM_29295 [Paenibacillus xylanexedens]